MPVIDLPMLSIAEGLVLILISFIGSTMTAAVGAGGGMLMLASLATVLPAPAIVPVHGAVQLGSNAGRMVMSRTYISYPCSLRILGGGLLGTLLAWPLIDLIPGGALECLIGLFVLFITWFSIPIPQQRQHRVSVAYGIGVGFLNLMVGAVGPLVGAYLRQMPFNRMEVVATMAFCLSALHVLKSLVFSVNGFVWTHWLVLIGALIASGLAGTRVGLSLLGKLPEQRFQQLFRIVITFISCHLLWRGGSTLL